MSKFNKFNTVVDKLSCVRRFSSHQLAKNENVLEHTGKVALLCLHIGEELQAEGFPVDMSYLLTKALIHDIEESESGDIISPVKYSSEALTVAFKEQEAKIAAMIFAETFTHSFVGDLWETSKNGPEGSIVAFVDIICAMYKIHNEVELRGNRSMSDAMTETSMITLNRKLDSMRENYPESKTMISLKAECNVLCEKLGLIKASIRGLRA